MPPINLYSDTQTRPTAGMRAAIAAAEVGDEQRGLDPTTRLLEERVAELLGFAAAVFLPSGTMCNEIALRLHARPGGDEVILDRTAHPVNSEAGGPAVVSGLMVRVLDGDRGVFTGADLEAAVRPSGNRYMPRSRLVCVEQTSNLGGGRVWPTSVVRAVLAVAARFGLRTHFDGARLLNAVVASGVPASAWASGFETAWIDFTKGLGAPVGAVLAGSRGDASGCLARGRGARGGGDRRRVGLTRLWRCVGGGARAVLLPGHCKPVPARLMTPGVPVRMLERVEEREIGAPHEWPRTSHR